MTSPLHDIKSRGYTGSFSNLERLLATWRSVERPEVDNGDAAPARIGLAARTLDNAPVRDPQSGHLIAPVVTATLCIKPRGALTIQSSTESGCPQTRITDVCCFAQLLHAISRNISWPDFGETRRMDR
ncbi:MAG: hypothetical protein I8N66_11850 [Ensifer sp. SSB1]|nr:hypothetical protein [Ensifer sp. SSB1]